VVPTVFVLETFIPILLGPLLLKTHLPLAPASQVAFFGGLALVLAAIIVIARSDPVTAMIRQSAEEAREQTPLSPRRPRPSPRRARRGRKPAGRPA
jgi:hypothetical protein